MVRLNEDETQADSCAICKFWEADDERWFTGSCHRYPPEAGRFIPTGEGRLEWVGAAYPKTAELDWCGEYAAALKEAGE